MGEIVRWRSFSVAGCNVQAFEFHLLLLTINGISFVQEFNVLWQYKASVVFLTLEIALIFNGAVILPGGLVKAHSDPNSRLEVNISNVLDGCTTFWSVWSQDIAMLSNLNFGRVLINYYITRYFLKSARNKNIISTPPKQFIAFRNVYSELITKYT